MPMVEYLNIRGIDGLVSCYIFYSLAYTGFTLKIANLSHL